MPRVLIVTVAALALAGCGSSKESAPPATTHSPTKPKIITTDPPVRKPPTGKVDVKITSDTHTPKVQTPWHYKVRVTARGKPVPARVSVVVLYHGTPVLNLGTHAAPKGVWAGTVRWPAATRAKLVVVNAQAVSKGRDGVDQFPVAGQ